MESTMNKAKKMIGIWTGDADALKELSHVTRRTQVELLHEAIHMLADSLLNREKEL